ncbi:MAG: glycoside hydrolase family 3 C-terminal domain-containing protein, partial [Gammaproteobacteria bacterium]|nr:glycoside hydrolase family 3 C-terminal domain-containing protein [Gammaproteobacteria bacterium]
MKDIESLLKELTLEEKASLVVGKDFWHTVNIDRLGIESRMMCDGPNGLRKQENEADHLGISESKKAVCFPTASSLASSFNKELVESLGEAIGSECQREKVSMILGPGANIKRSPLCGRNFEYFSEDPYLSGHMASSFLKGVSSKGIYGCLKHYACNSQETNRMSSNSKIDDRTLHEVYLKPFEIAVKSGYAKSIMSAYNKVNGTYCSQNHILLKDILRDRWGYDGFVVSDWGAAKEPDLTIKHGNDLIMPGGNKETISKIVNAVNNGSLDISELDLAVKNILNFALKDRKFIDEPIDYENDYNKALECALDSAVLLKNEDNILPLNKKSKVLFVGEFADKPRYQGAGSSHINSFKVSKATDYLSDNISFELGFNAEDKELNEELVSKVLEKALSSDVVVLFLGLPESMESEGKDRLNLDLPNCQYELVNRVLKVNKNVVVVLHNGSPILMPFKNDVKAILEMYLAGDAVGEATYKLLFGLSNPSGKLSESFPNRIEDTPCFLNYLEDDATYSEGVFVGYRYYDKKKMDVLFPFGYGLSYTNFKYNNLKVSNKDLQDKDKLSISFDVSNVGECDGKEVVQLYIRPINPKVSRPIRELKGFDKVLIKKGKTKELKFEIDTNAFSYYETKINDFYSATGDYAIEIASSSRDIRLCEVVHFTA